MKKLNYPLFFVFLFLGTLASAEEPSLRFGAPRYSGSGCPRGSVSFLPTEDAFTILFDSYVAERGNNLALRESFKQCFIQVDVEVPAGFTAAIETIDYRGFTRVEDKVKSYVMSSFSFGSLQLGSSPIKQFRGPQETDFLKRDLPYFTRKGACRNKRVIPLRVVTVLGVTGSTRSRGVIALDSIDGVVEAKLSVQPCRR